jgi:hypothetical protein
MTKILTKAVRQGAVIADCLTQFAAGTLVAFCGLTLALPLLLGNLSLG